MIDKTTDIVKDVDFETDDTQQSNTDNSDNPDNPDNPDSTRQEAQEMVTVQDGTDSIVCTTHASHELMSVDGLPNPGK